MNNKGLLQLVTDDDKQFDVSPEDIADWGTITAVIADTGTGNPIPVHTDSNTLNLLLAFTTCCNFSDAEYFRAFDAANYLHAKRIYYSLLTKLVARIHRNESKRELFARYKDHLPQAAYFAGRFLKTIPNLSAFYDTDYNVWVNAIRNGHLDATPYFKKSPAENKNIAIRYAAEYGHVEAVHLLLALPRDCGVNPAACNNAAIKWSASYGHAEIVRLLLAIPVDRRVDPAADKNCAIRLAAMKGHVEVVRLLLALPIDRGVDPDARPPAHCSAYEYACKVKNQEILALIEDWREKNQRKRVRVE